MRIAAEAKFNAHTQHSYSRHLVSQPPLLASFSQLSGTETHFEFRKSHLRRVDGIGLLHPSESSMLPYPLCHIRIL
jgi:hypothetical protein